jgi:hypothetical protein
MTLFRVLAHLHRLAAVASMWQPDLPGGCRKMLAETVLSLGKFKFPR